MDWISVFWATAGIIIGSIYAVVMAYLAIMMIAIVIKARREKKKEKQDER